jgi:hypothetical protein
LPKAVGSEARGRQPAPADVEEGCAGSDASDRVRTVAAAVTASGRAGRAAYDTDAARPTGKDGARVAIHNLDHNRKKNTTRDVGQTLCARACACEWALRTV